MFNSSHRAWSRGIAHYVATAAVGAGAAVIASLLMPFSAVRGQLTNTLGLTAFLCAAFLVALAALRIRRTVARERLVRLDAERALKRTGQLEGLATALSKSQTCAEATHACLSELLHATGAAAGVVALVSDDESRLDVVQAMGYADSHGPMSHSVPLDAKAALADAMRRHTPLRYAKRADLVADFPDAATADPVLGPGEGSIIVPLLVFGRGIGAVALSFADRHVSSSDEETLLTGAAKRTAIALDRTRRYERAERARADAEAFRVRADIELRERKKAEEALRESEARYRVLAARTNRLYTLSAALSEAVTLDAVAKAIVRHGRTVAGASAASVALLVDGRMFETLYAEEYPEPLMEAWHRFPAEPGLCATAAVETRHAVYIASFTEWQQQYPRSASNAADGGYASAAELPLLVEGAAIGVLSFHFTAPVNFDEQYRAVLVSVAQHAAQAIDRARLYEAAQRARTEAEAANRSKDDFLSIVSHELRTPLSAVLGWATMLRDHTLDPPRARRAVEAICSNATRQARLIDDLLDVSRIVAGRAPLDLQDVDVAATVRGAVEAIMPLAETKGIDLTLEPLPAGVHVVADPQRLEQVFMNLLGNAVKFTLRGGRVTVHVGTSDRMVDVRVSDTGRGIDPAFLPHVFERFRQADSTVVRSVGGLGLGLFIAHRLVHAHGGSIRAESEGEGRGAAFTVQLPAVLRQTLWTHATPEASAPVEGDATPVPAALGGVRVLVVDDEADVREMVTSVLEACGATVLGAPSAEAALDMLTGGRFDVLLADIAMPGKDGYELIRTIRCRPEKLAGIPAAAVTACARADERQRILSAGFQMHLPKPINATALARAVAVLAQMVVEPTLTPARADAGQQPIG